MPLTAPADPGSALLAKDGPSSAPPPRPVSDAPASKRTLVQWVRERIELRKDTEHQQILLRFIITAIFLLYVALTNAHAPRPPALAALLYAVCAIELTASLVLMSRVLTDARPSDLRRWVGMILDYSAIGLLMVVDGERTAPLYVVLMWVTVGNGLRYGQKFLRLAVLHATIAFTTALLLSPYWLANPYLGCGLLIGLIVVPLYLSSLLRDLTRAMDEAQRANAAKTRFVATMSHELRSPLNGIIGMSEVLTSTPLNPEQRECMDVIHTSAQSLLLVVEDVLNFAAIEAGKLRRYDAPFSLRQVIRKVRTVLHPLAASKNLQFQFDIQEGVPDWVSGDAGHTQQILLNLLNNALKFTEYGSVGLSVISLGEREGKHHIRFSIRDTGIGVPEEERERIFLPFHQIDSGQSRRYNGTGLGVTIVKTLTELLNGTVQLEGNSGGGTHFWVDVPYNSTHQVADTAHAQPDSLAHRQHNPVGATVLSIENPFVRHRNQVRPMRLLVADDLPSNRLLMQRLLRRAGHDILLASNGEQALDILAETDVDAAIVDLHMPDNTGLDVIKQARLLEAGLRQRTPIIILSADVTLETVREVEANGAYAYLSKPLVIEKLLDLLATIAGENRPDTTPAPTDSETPRVSILKGLIDMDVDPESLQHLLEQCLTDATDCIGQIERAGAASRWEELRDGLHALCGVAVNIGAGALADRCASLMREVPSDLASHWRRDVDGLSGLLAAASVEVRLQIEGLTGFKDLERREAPPV